MIKTCVPSTGKSSNLKTLEIMIAKAVFIWLMLTGQVKYQQTMDGRKQYALFFEDGKVVDYATKAEILEYIQSGDFEYNEDL
jgi:hypothetical protein